MTWDTYQLTYVTQRLFFFHSEGKASRKVVCSMMCSIHDVNKTNNFLKVKKCRANFLLNFFGQLTDHYELLSLKKRQPPGIHTATNKTHRTIVRRWRRLNKKNDLFWKTYKSEHAQLRRYNITSRRPRPCGRGRYYNRVWSDLYATAAVTTTRPIFRRMQQSNKRAYCSRHMKW